MFNKKLKHKIMVLEFDISVLKEKEESQNKVISALNETIEAQAFLIEAFAKYIVESDKKGRKNEKKRKK